MEEGVIRRGRSRLSGALASGREKEGELATTSLEFQYLHRKSRCEMLIGGDDISNDVITPHVFLMFVYICAPFHFALIGGNPTAESKGSHRGIGGEFKLQRRSCKLSFLFPPERAPERAPRRACSQAKRSCSYFVINEGHQGHENHYILSLKPPFSLRRASFCLKCHV